MLAVDPTTGLPVVVLVPVEDGDRLDSVAPGPVVISIGLAEASALAVKLDGIELERPTTYDLTLSLLGAAGVRIDSIEIHDVCDGQFRARVHLRLPTGERAARDSRPSDALALALHAGVDIAVAPRVIQAAALADVDELVPGDPAGGRDAMYMDPGVRTGMLMLSPQGGCIEGDLSDLSDEAYGKWKM